MSFDPRLTLRRGGLAAAWLEGKVEADAFVEPRPHQACVADASIRAQPTDDAEQVDELLFGERFDVLEAVNGFAFGQAVRDGYVGYVAARALTEWTGSPTHRVSGLRACAFAEPDIKSPAEGLFSLNALMTIDARDGRFLHARGAGWIAGTQLAGVGEAFEADPAEVALRLLGAPYVWGGRDSTGVDCSGLVQLALYACGRACPRDSDQQAALGRPVEGVAALGRNDLVFWDGHVGIMLDGDRLLHANAHHMAVTVEPFAGALVRIEAAGGGRPTALRRL